MNLLDKIKQNPEEISFDEVIAYIDEHYKFHEDRMVRNKISS